MSFGSPTAYNSQQAVPCRQPDPQISRHLVPGIHRAIQVLTFDIVIDTNDQRKKLD